MPTPHLLYAVVLAGLVSASCAAPPASLARESSTREAERRSAAPPAANSALPATAELLALVGMEPTDAQLADALAYLGGDDKEPATTLKSSEMPLATRPKWRSSDHRGNPVIDNIRGLDVDLARGMLVSKVIEAFYSPRVVNGEFDDRFDPSVLQELGEKEPWKKAILEAELAASRAVGVLFHAETGADGRLHLPVVAALGERRGLCPGERFADEPSIAGCSGVLVSSDVVATALHCLGGQGPPLWVVFDYRNGKNATPGAAVPADDAYRAELWKHSSADDWALLRLDRAVVGRSPAIIRPSRPTYVSPGEYVFAAGHPDGIPLKVTRSGKVVRTTGNRFVTNLDLFRGNSGSPIFDRVDPARRRMIGLVLSGMPDYRRDGACQVVAHCLPGQCAPAELALRADVLARALEDE